MTITCFIYLADSHVGTPFFARHTYIVVSPKCNEWGNNFWRECCIKGKKTINVTLMDVEDINFIIGLMIFKGEYLKVSKTTWKKKGLYLKIIDRVIFLTHMRSTWRYVIFFACHLSTFSHNLTMLSFSQGDMAQVQGLTMHRNNRHVCKPLSNNT